MTTISLPTAANWLLVELTVYSNIYIITSNNSCLNNINCIADMMLVYVIMLKIKKNVLLCSVLSITLKTLTHPSYNKQSLMFIV